MGSNGERNLFKGLIQNIQHIAQQSHFLIAFSIDPWNCTTRGGDQYANVADNIDWINNKIWAHESKNIKRSSGSNEFKSHLFTLLFIISWIYLVLLTSPDLQWHVWGRCTNFVWKSYKEPTFSYGTLLGLMVLFYLSFILLESVPVISKLTKYIRYM